MHCLAALAIAAGVAGCERGGSEDALSGDPARGASLIASLDCGVCHAIPGVPGANGTVGPPLARFARRSYIAGRAANQPQNLQAWILDPPSIAPGTAMPRMPITTDQARDIAAYLYTLR